MDSHHLLLAGLPAHPISAVRGAIIEPLRSTQTGLRPTSIFTRPDPVAAIG
jgi:hypothetical protein